MGFAAERPRIDTAAGCAMRPVVGTVLHVVVEDDRWATPAGQSPGCASVVNVWAPAIAIGGSKPSLKIVSALSPTGALSPHGLRAITRQQ